MVKCVLLTGSTGFLGSHILRGLLHAGYRVICLKRSFSNNQRNSDLELKEELITYDIDNINLEDVFTENSIQFIVHTATLYGRNDEAATLMLQSNVLFPLQLLELGVRYKIKAFINTDTFINDEKKTYHYLGNYTLSKKQFHDWLITCSDKIKIANCKLWHLYGPKDDKSKFIVHIIQSFLSNKSFIELTDGLQKRDFVYVADVVAAYLSILNNIENIPNGISEFNVGSGQSFSIRYIVEQIKLLSGNTSTELQFGALPQRQGEYQDSVASITNLQRLGWKPSIDIKQGLLETITSERNNFLI